MSLPPIFSEPIDAAKARVLIELLSKSSPASRPPPAGGRP